MKVPTLKDLKEAVRPRVLPESSLKTSAKLVEKEGLSFHAREFLHHAMLPGNERLGLEARWKQLGIVSGAQKKRILDELGGQGLLRLDQRGRYKVPALYPEAYEALDTTPVKGKGTGGPTHQEIVRRLAERLRKRGFDVRIEVEIGPRHKRIDLLALGKVRLGVEVGLSSVAQEVKNLDEDFASGALDYVLVVCRDAGMLKEIEICAKVHTRLSKHIERIRFRLIALEDTE